MDYPFKVVTLEVFGDSDTWRCRTLTHAKQLAADLVAIHGLTIIYIGAK